MDMSEIPDVEPTLERIRMYGDVYLKHVIFQCAKAIREATGLPIVAAVQHTGGGVMESCEPMVKAALAAKGWHGTLDGTVWTIVPKS